MRLPEHREHRTCGQRYADPRGVGAVTSVTFLVANVTRAVLTMASGPSLHGPDDAGAARAARFLSRMLPWRHLAHLKLMTFARPPVGR
jgi:hypothetical protein